MNAENFNVTKLLEMAHSPLQNYIIPGLKSSLIGSPSPKGAVRLFECAREHEENVVPHSHRFDFQCWVLRGSVRNRIWLQRSDGDRYQVSSIKYDGAPGQYKKTRLADGSYLFHETKYEVGQCYSMLHKDIHSIFFSRGAVVLFFEGPTVTDTSLVLEPVVDGQVIETLKTEPWMFKAAAGGEHG